jgi:hypothetical protein
MEKAVRCVVRIATVGAVGSKGSLGEARKPGRYVIRSVRRCAVMQLSSADIRITTVGLVTLLQRNRRLASEHFKTECGLVCGGWISRSVRSMC